MKKLFLAFLFILILPSILAVEFDINENFSQGETIVAKISGSFSSPITSDNIFFYRGHVQIPIEYEVSKMDGDYYLYALTSGKSPDNYSVSIQNAQYMQGSNVVNDTISRNFTITNQTADFSVNPGFAVVSEDFYLEVQNLQDKKITISVNTQPNISNGRILISSSSSTTSSLTLNSGETKKINFQIQQGQSAVQKIELKTENLIYEIPIYITTSFGDTQTKAFGIDPSVLTLSFQTNATGKQAVYLFNSENTDLKNVALSISSPLNSSVTLSKSSIANLSANSGTQIELSFFSKTERKVEGTISVVSGNRTISSFVSVNFLNNYTAPAQTPSVTTRTCAEFKGKVCVSGEECSIEPIYAKDGVCCLGTCAAPKSSSTGTIIAVIILVVIIAGIAFFYLKYKKAKKPVNLLEVAKGKEKI
jgi:hypothetical protein